MSAETNARLSDEVVAEEFYTALQHAYRELRERFLIQRENKGITQQIIADRLGCDKALISRRLHGRANLTFRTMSALATAMDSRLKVEVVGHEEMAAANYRYDAKLLDTLSFASGSESGKKAEPPMSSTPRPYVVVRHTKRAA